jgi:succinate dehydrogenase / fumarate reductase cytochrome b subunit
MQTLGWKRFVSTTVGNKLIVGITGLGISLFVLIHMAGNCFLLVSPQAYNEYSYHLVSNPLLPVAEIGLLLCFLLHIFFTLRLARANARARPIGNYQVPAGPKSGSFAVRTMALSGLLLLAFLILHLITFKWGAYYAVQYNGVEMRDLYRLVSEKFHEPGYVAWYVLCLCLLGMHLSHGFAATFQSLGIARVRNCSLRLVGWVFAAVVALGFISQPLFFILGGGGLYVPKIKRQQTHRR